MVTQSCAIQIFTVHCGVPHFDVLFCSNLWEYNHKSYTPTAWNDIKWATFSSHTVWSRMSVPIESPYAISKLSCSYSQIFAFKCGYLSLMHYFSVISWSITNVTIYHILPQTTFLGLHFCHRQYGSNFSHCDVIGLKGTEFGKKTQKTIITVQCLRSFKVTNFGTMERPYVTSYVWITVT